MPIWLIGIALRASGWARAALRWLLASAMHPALAACALLAVFLAEPAAAWPDRMSEGLWEKAAWITMSGEKPDKTVRNRTRRCEASQVLDDWGKVFYAPGGRSQAQRATIASGSQGRPQLL